MTALDWGIVAFALAMGIWGYRQGLIVGALTLAGFLAGAFAGSRLGPLLLSGGSRSPYSPLFAAIGALMVGAVVAVALEGIALGLRERLIRGRALDALDGAGGAVLIVAVALGLAWVFGAAALHAPGTAQLRDDVQRSVILRKLNDLLPPSGPVLNALSRVDPAPTVAGPAGPVARPDPAVIGDPDVIAARRSVVRVLGTACGLGVEGSGWVAAPDLVVTNAHVVAGETDTTVTTEAGASLSATPIHYDPANDLAILRIEGPVPPLAIAPRARRGTAGALLGYPENGPFTATPVRLGDTRKLLSDDSYGRGPIQRRLTYLRGSVHSGNSGGPVVDTVGRVMATVFASTTSAPSGGFAIPNGIVRAALGEASSPVDTGPCTG
jgi:S1-C subfamily serine protease